MPQSHYLVHSSYFIGQDNRVSDFKQEGILESVFQLAIMKCLLYARHCAKHWSYKERQKQSLLSRSSKSNEGDTIKMMYEEDIYRINRGSLPTEGFKMKDWQSLFEAGGTLAEI